MGKARISRNADKGGTWRVLRELGRILRRQDEDQRTLIHGTRRERP